MNNIFTIGFSKKTANQFFDEINNNDIDIVIDVRYNNVGQLAGFTKKNDLDYFLKKICNCEYCHEIEFAPTKDLLSNYRKKNINWEEYQNQYMSIIKHRDALNVFISKYQQYKNILFLCSEDKPDFCHRRILAEYIGNSLNTKIIHL